MAYKNGGKYKLIEAREKFVEANATSLLWLGGIPVLRKVFDKAVFKPLGYNPNIDLRLLTKNGAQTIEKVIEKAKGADKIALEKVAENKSVYRALHISKTLVSSIIPFLILTSCLPKWNYSITNNVLNKKAKDPEYDNKFLKKEYFDKNFKGSNEIIRQRTQDNINFKSFTTEKNASNVSFGGFKDLFNPVLMAQEAQLSPVSNMVFLDLGISGSRMYNEGKRSKAAAIETGLKEGGIIYFMYIGGRHIAKLIETLSEKVLKTPINLDPKILEGNTFVSAIKNKQSIQSLAHLDEAGMLKFIDENLKNGKFSDLTLQYAAKTKLIKLKDGSRDALKYIEVDKIKQLNENMIKFAQKAANIDNVDQFMNKVKVVKRTGIVANIAISTFLMSYVIPKLQYAFRKKYTGGQEHPGILAADDKAHVLAEQKKLG